MGKLKSFWFNLFNPCIKVSKRDKINDTKALVAPQDGSLSIKSEVTPTEISTETFPLLNLPDDLVSKIVAFLSQTEKLQLRATSSSLRQIIDSAFTFRCYLNTRKIQEYKSLVTIPIDHYVIRILPNRLLYKVLVQLTPPTKLSFTSRMHKLDLFILSSLWSHSVEDVTMTIFTLESPGLFKRKSTSEEAFPIPTEYFPGTKSLTLILTPPKRLSRTFSYRMSFHKVRHNLRRMCHSAICNNLRKLVFHFQRWSSHWQSNQCYFVVAMLVSISRCLNSLKHFEFVFLLKNYEDDSNIAIYPHHGSSRLHQTIIGRHLRNDYCPEPTGFLPLQLTHCVVRLGSMKPCTGPGKFCDQLTKIIKNQRSLQHLAIGSHFGLAEAGSVVQHVLPKNYATLVHLDVKIQMASAQYFDLTHLSCCSHLKNLRLMNILSAENYEPYMDWKPRRIKRKEDALLKNDVYSVISSVEKLTHEDYEEMYPHSIPDLEGNGRVVNFVFSDVTRFPKKLENLALRGFSMDFSLTATVIHRCKQLQCFYLRGNYMNSHPTETGLIFFTGIMESPSLKKLVFVPPCNLHELMRKIYRNCKCHMKFQPVLGMLKDLSWRLVWDFDQDEDNVSNPSPIGFTLDKIADSIHLHSENYTFDHKISS